MQTDSELNVNFWSSFDVSRKKSKDGVFNKLAHNQVKSYKVIPYSKFVVGHCVTAKLFTYVFAIFKECSRNNIIKISLRLQEQSRKINKISYQS